VGKLRPEIRRSLWVKYFKKEQVVLGKVFTEEHFVVGKIF
jgi:hypothetical protein